MAIPLQRFRGLEEDTQLPVADFYSESGADILNQKFAEISPELDNQLAALQNEKIPEMADLFKSSIPNELESLQRSTKDFLSDQLDISSLSLDGLDSVIGKMFSGFSGASFISNMLRKSPVSCTGGVLGGPGSRRPQLPGMGGCNSGGNRFGRNNGNCSVSSFDQLLQALGGNGLGLNMIDPSLLEKLLAGLGLHGYNLGLCNVFSALLGGFRSNGMFDTNAIGRGTGTLLSMLGQRGDIMGVMDIGRNLNGINVLGSVPNISSMIMGGFQTPDEIMDRDMAGFFQNYSYSMEGIDPGWLSGDDGMMSVSNMFDNASGMVQPGLLDTFQAGMFDKDISGYFTDPLSGGSSPDLDYLCTGMEMGSGSTMDSLSSELPFF